ncbi:MAG: tRNA (adenosine(37)-N6)-threonylcarbamoyltransferase complex dimerization subunit type 1 TsaB [Rhodospirillales bacterium]
MRILAIDTAAGACSAAVWDDGRVHQRLLEMSRGHAEALLPLLLATLADAGRSFADLDLLAVTVGPGAFTGLRVGLAAARGLALATGLPCLGVTTLEAVAAAVSASEAGGRPLLVALDSKRGDVYAQVFIDREAANEAAVAAPDDLARLLAAVPALPAGPPMVAGDAAAMVLPTLAAGEIAAAAATAPGYPLAEHVAAIAARRAPAGGVTLPPPVPLYLRPPATGPQPAVPAKAAGRR